MFCEVNITYRVIDITTLPFYIIRQSLDKSRPHLDIHAFDITTQSLDKSTPHLGIVGLLSDIIRQRLGMSTLLLTRSDSCGVPN